MTEPPEGAPSVPDPPSRLLLVGAIAYPALVLYGSLFPLTEWRASGLSPYVFLSAAFPRYWTGFDLIANVALYVPLGFVWGLGLLRRARPGCGVGLAIVVASGFSLGIEFVQNWLPSRVPSNLDWLCNSAGALLGGLLARRFAAVWAVPLGAFRRRFVAGDRGAEEGLALLGVWIVIQLSPDAVLFCSALVGHAGVAWLPLIGSGQRMPVEAAAVAMHTLLAGLLARQVMVGKLGVVLARILLGGLLVIGLKATVSAFGLGFPKAFLWMSNGATWGVTLGAGGLLVASLLPSRARLAVMLGALLAGSALLLALPASPYVPGLAAELAASPVRNFVGVLNWLGVLWPALVAGYLLWRLIARPK